MRWTVEFSSQVNGNGLGLCNAIKRFMPLTNMRLTDFVCIPYIGNIAKFIGRSLVLRENIVLCWEVISKAALPQQTPLFQARSVTGLAWSFYPVWLLKDECSSMWRTSARLNLVSLSSPSKQTVLSYKNCFKSSVDAVWWLMQDEVLNLPIPIQGFCFIRIWA